jgi:uncharacterized protein with von Willebrand factor type A (vWA) domain
LDLREALDEIGRDVMEGSSPRSAMEELLRRGTGNTQGLDELTRRLWQKRSEIQRRNNLDGTMNEVRDLLDKALAEERKALFPDPSDDARFAEARLDALPTGTAAAVNELSEYPWRSEQAREAYQQIQDLLGQQLMESRFSGMKDALQNVDQAQVDAMASMLEDLNDLLAKHATGADTTEDFEKFMAEHGQYFPENPRNTEELVDALAARSAAAQRMMNSMSSAQREELQQLAQQAFGDPRIGSQLSTMDAQLRALRPGEDWESSARMRGKNPMGLGEGAQAMQDLGDLDALAEQLSQSYPGARLEDIDVDSLVEQLGDQAGVDARRLAELERELARGGLFERAEDGSLRLSPKALRRLAQTALRDAIGQLRAARGERDIARSGAAGELIGSSRPWQFGDTEPWDVPRTVRNAVLRNAETGSPTVTLDVVDVEVAETEQRERAAVALLVDTSWSMVAEGRWLPMKRTALALHQLISTRFRTDALQLIAFGRHARSVELPELVAMDGTWEQGTNLHHGLLLAGRHFRKHSDANPVLLVVTDGEPTAHLEPDGEAIFDYPPTPRTLAATLSEVDRIAKLGAATSIFRLGDDPRLTEFVNLLARKASGRVIAPDLDGLGAAVVADYLRGRKRR